MENKEFAKHLEVRTRNFAISIIKLTSKLSNDPEARVLKYQLSKSGTSIGANYREANRARSRADFKNKIRICESEASETVYWLEIISEIEKTESNRFVNIKREASEILAIFSSIGKNIKL